MKTAGSCFIVFLLCMLTAASAQDVQIKMPDTKDKYADYVKQLESGNTGIDYTDFRNSFLESKQFSRKDAETYNNLKKEVYDKIRSKDYNGVITLTKKMLGLDYTSMFAHMYLQKTFNILGDTISRNKYHDIEFGLINSIIKSGDGKTCATGWHVTQIEEEYFIINVVIDAEFKKQSIVSGGKNTCDEMIVKTEDGTENTYYFEANKIFEMEQKMFDKK